MAEGSRYASYFVKELASGVTPSNPQLDVFRLTKTGLDFKINPLQSAEIRDDAEIADFRLGTRHAEGTASSELSYGTFDLLIAAALRGTWTGDTVKGGVERASFTFVEYNADILDLPYTVYRGCEVNTMQIKVSASAMTTIEFGLVGRSMEQLSELPAGWTIKPRTTTSPMDGFSGALQANGADLAVVTEMQINLENGIAPRFVVGSKTSIVPSAKSRKITGSLASYFEDNSLRLAYLNELTQNMVVNISDGAAGNTYTISLPRVKLTEAPRPVEGEGDIMQNLSYQALLDSTEAFSIKIQRHVVPPAPTGVIVTPAYTASMPKSGTRNFKATVTGTTAQNVTWEVTPTANGTITPQGVFTAAATATGKTTITAKATALNSVVGKAVIAAFTEAVS